MPSRTTSAIIPAATPRRPAAVFALATLALAGLAASAAAQPANGEVRSGPATLGPDGQEHAGGGPTGPVGWSLVPPGGYPAPAPWAYARCFSADSVLTVEGMEEWRRRVTPPGDDPFNQRFFTRESWADHDNQPVQLTWSIVPDGTLCTYDNSTIPSSLISSLDSRFGDRGLWVSNLQSCFDAVSMVCGLRFTRTMSSPEGWDDGEVWPRFVGQEGLRGDIRIAGGPIVDSTPGLNTFAFAFYPSGGGNLLMDTAEAWNDNVGGNFRFMRNVLTHEVGHASGLAHVCPLTGTKLMEPIYSPSFDGLQADDILGLQSLYGDPQEPDDYAGAAVQLLESQPNTSVTFFTYGQVPGAATASVLPGDQDWIRSSVAAEMPVTITATPAGAGYDSSPQGSSSGDNPSGCTSGHFVDSRLQSGLIVEIRDSTLRVLASSQGGPGAAVTAVASVPGGSYYTVIKPVSTDFSMPQMYTLTRTVGAPRAPGNDPWFEGYLLDDGEYGPRMAGTTFGASTDGNALIEPGGDIGVQDVYYNFTPWDGPGFMRVTVTGGGHVVSVHNLSSRPTSSTQLMPIDSNGGRNGVVDVDVPDRNTHLIRVAVGPGGAPGPHEVSVRYVDGPTNDDCSAPVDITTGVYSGSTIFARRTRTLYPVSCTADTSIAPAGVWYRFTATADGSLALSVCDSHDTILGVYDSCPESGGRLIACNDNADACGAGGSALTLNVQAGHEYLVRVSHVQNMTDIFHLNVAYTRAGESCTTAQPLRTGQTPFSNAGYTSDDGSCFGGANRWYSYTATGHSTITLDACNSSYDTTLAAWTGCPSQGGQLITCNDDSCGLRSRIAFEVAPGQPLYFSVGGYQGSTGSGVLNLVETPVAGEVCSSPIVITEGSFPYSTLGCSTDGPAEPNCNYCCGDPQVHGDIWYAYTATGSGTLTLASCGADYDSKMAAYASCPTGDGQAIACADDECGVQARLTFHVDAGRGYLLRVGGYGGLTGSGTLTLALAPDCNADFNGDGFLDFFDYDDYVGCFETAACPAGRTADFNDDGFADFFDYDDFVAAFEGGC